MRRQGHGANQTIDDVGAASEFASEGSLPASGVDKPAAEYASLVLFLHDFEQPSAIRVLTNRRNSGGDQERCSRLSGGVGEHRVKTSAIDVPSGAVGIEEE